MIACLSVCLCVCAVGEPLNIDAWKWYYEVVGDKRCPIVDTWWQTGVVRGSGEGVCGEVWCEDVV